MKKVIVLLAIILVATFPVLAAAVGESAAAGAATGASVGSVVPGIGTAIGTFVGAAIGTVVGFFKQSAQDDEKRQQYESAIASLDLENESLSSQNSTYATALAAWNNEYEANVGNAVETYKQNISELKDDWGNTNAEIAQAGGGGATARLLSEEKKDKVVAYAGNDMKLNNAEVESLVQSAFQDTSKLSTIKSSNYGIYEKQLIDTMASYRQNKQTMQQTLDLNEQAIKKNKQSIKYYEDLESNLWF